ncbi:MAG: hypothetical protein B7X00_00035 [Legionella sp. 21-45-4]|nr:MAG: hypothetical protein B7X00_00035 [Legionella sp. 21-45-4]
MRNAIHDLMISPKNIRGIVMRKESLLQNHFKDTFSFMHKKRQTVLFGAVDALMEGASLTLSSLGRNFKGAAKERHQIRKMDRLLGNKHLHQEIPMIYKGINELIITKNKPVISVDWSCLSYAEGIYLLRASLRINGRSLVCYQEIHPKEHENNDTVHCQFLDNLKSVLPLNTAPIIVTDAIFSTLWFKKVIDLGWHFVGRVRTNRGNYFYQDKWRPVSEAYQQATSIPNSFNHCLLTEKNKLPCRMVIYKKLPQGRKKKNAKGCLAKGSYENALAKGSKDPWFLATSLTEEEASALEVVKYYSSRMQIEEEFRDTKSHKYGFGLSDSGTKIHIRIHVLLIINLLASIFCWIIACSAVQKKQHLDYHANSSKKLNILSAITLGKRVYKKIKNFSVYHFKAAFSYWIKLINGQLIYGEIL